MPLYWPLHEFGKRLVVKVVKQWARTAKAETVKYVKRKIAAAANDDSSGVRQPFLEPEGQRYLRECLRDAESFLEFGAGGSTLLAVTTGVTEITTVESDAGFLAMIAEEVRAVSDATWRGLHADIGLTKKWGYPADKPTAEMGLAYALRPFPTNPDVVLIDGRFRAACCLATALHARVGTRILFDDYAGREYYRGVERHLGKPEMVGGMAVFVVGHGSRDGIEPDLEMFAADAR